MRIAVIYDNRDRPETTGFYCRRALSKLTDTEQLLPDELPLIPANLFDLFVFIDDGLDYDIPDSLRPRAAWAIDTHLDLKRAVERFGNADFLFAAQKNGAAALSKTAGRDVTWLPLACDPELHRPLNEIHKDLDVGFVGHPVGERRSRLISVLKQRYPNAEFCQALFDEMARVYSRARIGFNCSVRDDLNMRLFEVPAHGIPLVTNQIDDNGLEELFEPGRHLLTWQDDQELIDTIDRLLEDIVLRERIGEAGRQHVLAEHTYLRRMQTLLKTCSAAATTTVSFTKARDYFEFPRPDVQALIPASAHRILDIGCGAGALGADLKRHRDVHVTGIELNSDAAERATTRLDKVLNVSAEKLRRDDFEAPFDCIVMADVLEHLRDPFTLLTKCRQWLSTEGSIVVSVPNSRHHSVVSGLLDGNWTYEKAGLLDEDHVRCFTRREIEKLLYRSGFFVEEQVPVPGPGHQRWEGNGRPGQVFIGPLQLANVAPEEAEEFYTYQYVLRGRPEYRKDFGLTSVIIVTWNQLPFTKECVDSILARTDESIELIFVDNGSTDGTPDYLESIPAATVIRNTTNRGYAPAVNQGLEMCHGDNILLLNNDCVVTTGWLDGLLEALHDDEQNGLVGPVSDNVSGEQQISVPYRDLTSMDGFAWDRRRDRRLTVTDRLVGFCLLFRRRVIQQIGLFDEQFEIGCFEDDDFCRRATGAGYRSLIAHHVFVHHYGSATFRGAGLDLGRILQVNHARYQQKWIDRKRNRAPESAADAPIASARYTARGLPTGRSLLQRTTIRLSLCMIVRDNEDTIEACLDSIYPWVDEIIIVDTGSTDATPEICRRFGARMYEFPWCDDFSAARNVSLGPARGDWIFWMDSDDIIHEEQGRRLRELVYGPHDDHCFGYVMQVHCPSSNGQMTIVDHVKVFRNLPELRFEHRIHEQILPAIRRLNGNVTFIDIHVVHSGSDQTPAVRQRKLERDFRILKLDLEERPDHPFVLFNLGMTCEDAGQYQEAEQHLRRSLEVSSTGESHLRKAWALLINCQRMQGRVDEAINTATNALSLFDGDKELLFRRGTLYHDLGQLQDAESDYRQVIEKSANREFQSIDPAITGHKVYYNLALVLNDADRPDEAVDWWTAAVKENPTFAAGWMALARSFRRTHSAAAISDLVTQMPDVPPLQSCRAIVEALGAEAENRILDAQRVLETAWSQTENAACLDELARILAEHGLMSEAVNVLQRLHDLRPDDAAVLHNLGQALNAIGNQKAAAECIRESLRLRPDAGATKALLAATTSHAKTNG